MPIPESTRVRYEHNTLEQVICQLRFPPILRIGAEPPAGFQELVRGDYPRYSEQSEASIMFPPGSGIPVDIAKLVPSITAYEFASANEEWKLTLSRDFIALSCTAYTTWEVFLGKLEIALQGLVHEFQPAFYSRIGLRYQNVIRRPLLGLSGVNWAELLNPHAIGELATPLSGDVDRVKKETMLRLEQFEGRVRVLQGTVRDEGQDEDSFLIDCDYFTGQETEPANAIQALAYFNRQSGNLFRWYIQPRLHEAMAPRAI